jgi:cysteinyl-tRNA synthetase
MKLKLYNTLSRKLEIFEPISKDIVKMYVCGPTVYDHPHIGNARSVVVYDVLYRMLTHIFNAKVIYVRNITDVDDKIINKSKESGLSIQEITTKVEQDFHYAMNYLGCLQPSIEPRATEHIQEMIDIIQKLLDNGCAYISDNHVYFKVSSSVDYTTLSGRNFDEMLEAVRIEKSVSKNDNMDFVLWKPAEESDPPSANFLSPWGVGRPGWHIECSAMSYKYLGADFDIHGGGADLIFPHHTNEIAQSTCAFKGSKFARFWIHNGFLTVNGQKMSKSLGNFITVKDLIEQNVKGDVIRLLLLSTSYRKPLDFSKKALDDASKMMDYWYRALQESDYDENIDISDIINDLYHDLNTPKVIAKLHSIAKLVFSDSANKKHHASRLYSGCKFVGFINYSTCEWFKNSKEDISLEILEKIEKRKVAKLAKNWTLADQIRQELLDEGVILEDAPDGLTYWKKHY